MKYWLLLVGVIFCSCQKKEITSKQILENSIEFHDPDHEWSKFQGRFYLNSQSVFTDNMQEQLILEFDIPNDELLFENRTKGEKIHLIKSDCEILKGSVSCENVGWVKSFYTYTWGLPMKLEDVGTVLKSMVIKDSFNEKPCYRLEVDYENDFWSYYVNQETFQLEGYRFFTNKEKTEGEIVVLSNVINVKGMKLPSHQEWRDAVDNKVLGTTELTKVK